MSIPKQPAAALILAVSVLGQTLPSPPSPTVPILLEAALPTYPPIWQAAHLSGKVIVRVTVKSGRVIDTAVQSGEPHLQVPTVMNIKTWRFDDQVSGELTVSYTYEISGEPSDAPTNPGVEILPALDVKITARPVRPTCMDCRAPEGVVLPN